MRVLLTQVTLRQKVAIYYTPDKKKKAILEATHEVISGYVGYVRTILQEGISII